MIVCEFWPLYLFILDYSVVNSYLWHQSGTRVFNKKLDIVLKL